jgi:hypothetical protein
MSKSDDDTAGIGGSFAPGFDRVRDAFAENFRFRGETGITSSGRSPQQDCSPASRGSSWGRS